jgi:hypothetical protein
MGIDQDANPLQPVGTTDAPLRPESPLSQRTGRGGKGGEGKRRLITALLGIQLLLAAIALAVWVWTPDRPPLPPLPAGSAPLVGSGATYESALPIAQAQGEAWLPGAILLNASMQVDWPWSVPAGSVTAIPGTGWLTYGFVAPWDPPGRPPGAAFLGVVIERLTGVVVTQETEGWEQAPELRPPSRLPPVPARFTDVPGRRWSHRVASTLGRRLRGYPRSGQARAAATYRRRHGRGARSPRGCARVHCDALNQRLNWPPRSRSL